MDVEYDDRGNVLDVKMSAQEAMRRGLLRKPSERIHPMLRAEQRRHEEARLRAMELRDLEERRRRIPEHLQGRSNTAPQDRSFRLEGD